MSEAPGEPGLSIADLVFAGAPSGGSRRLAIAGGVVLTLYAGVVELVSRLGHPAGSWSAEMAARIHDAIAIERAVDLTPPPPSPPPRPAPASDAPRLAPTHVARSARAPRAAPAPPAQAAQLAAAAPAPADFTGMAFVVGSGATYAGGATTSHGTSRTPATGDVASGGTGTGGAVESRSRLVSLDEAAWSCPWPAEADAQQVNEQTVVLRAAVRSDGRAERVDVVADPGFGFGAAARQCALATRFEPARDPSGQPIAALSPPIRVHFVR